MWIVNATEQNVIQLTSSYYFVGVYLNWTIYTTCTIYHVYWIYWILEYCSKLNDDFGELVIYIEWAGPLAPRNISK